MSKIKGSLASILYSDVLYANIRLLIVNVERLLEFNAISTTFDTSLKYLIVKLCKLRFKTFDLPATHTLLEFIDFYLLFYIHI